MSYSRISQPPKQKSPEELQSLADQWNRNHFVGAEVTRYALINPLREPTVTKTTSEAWVMGGHSVVVMVEGFPGGQSLQAVIPNMNFHRPLPQATVEVAGAPKPLPAASPTAGAVRSNTAPAMTAEERAMAIWELGVNAAQLLDAGDRPGLKDIIKRARELGVEIEDGAFDGALGKAAEKTAALQGGCTEAQHKTFPKGRWT
jgi:hypothetical protein